jgi:hypothetical protein
VNALPKALAPSEPVQGRQDEPDARRLVPYSPTTRTHGRAHRASFFGHVYGTQDLVWDGDTLRLRKTGRVVATIERDGAWPKLWRVRIGGRRELRELTPEHREWFHTMATATVKALSEGRAATITTNVPAILDVSRRLGSHLRASIEVVERDELIDIILRPGRRNR